MRTIILKRLSKWKKLTRRISLILLKSPMRHFCLLKLIKILLIQLKLMNNRKLPKRKKVLKNE